MWSWGAGNQTIRVAIPWRNENCGVLRSGRFLSRPRIQIGHCNAVLGGSLFKKRKIALFKVAGESFFRGWSGNKISVREDCKFTFFYLLSDADASVSKE